ncbi:MAG: aminoglycoside phosphotransferase family protein [Planctomycetota bacterium]|nr:aminoglycoside phosphotransferase family protein [Planctomycetota bacterium]
MNRFDMMVLKPFELDAKFCEQLRGLLVQAGVWPADVSLDERGGCVEVGYPPGGTGVAGAEPPATRPHLQIRRILGGANNAVFRVDLPDRVLLLKQFFSAASDDRDRYGAEIALVEFAWRHGIRAVPQLLACSREGRLALLEFLKGRPVAAAEVDESLLQQAVRFCQQLQAVQADPAARSLPTAAEACFSVDQHLACLERRLARLRLIPLESDLQREALHFVQSELEPRWRDIRSRVLVGCQATGIRPEQALEQRDRCLSPSDFGFHNALLEAHGNLRFFDFEYAGWDDPAKLVCDFFCQVEVPVPRRFLGSFANGIASGLPIPARLLNRIDLLLPVFQLKWCCIILNEFLPAGRSRRRFSSPDLRPERRPEVQLQKARRLLEDLNRDSPADPAQ